MSLLKTTARTTLAVLAGLLLLGAAAFWFRGYLVPFLPEATGAQGATEGIRLPPGFEIAVYAADLPGARSLALSPSGTLFVGTRQQGIVYAVVDRDGDYRAEQVHRVASGLNTPNGVAFRDGALYVAEVDRILRFADIEASLASPPAPEVVTADYPDDAHHGWKFIAFGPDGRLYVPVGAPCNVCRPDRPIYASITRLDPASGEIEPFASGVRNTVGFDWHPQTGELWFTDNGRDWLGDNRPPDELNRASQPGLHFGFPFCHGRDIPDPEFGAGRDCAEFTPPVRELGPHVAALGMRFYRGSQFPPRYRDGVFIAEHGSWNRRIPIGYRVSFVGLDDQGAPSYEVFAEGWLRDGYAAGRPVDVQEMPDGSLLVSDDKGGRVYRIRYVGGSPD